MISRNSGPFTSRSVSSRYSGVRPTSARWAWVEYQLAMGGIEAGLRARADANAAALDAWVERTPWVRNLASVPQTRSNTSVCLVLDADEAVPKAMVKMLAAEGVAVDIGSYRDAPPGLRIWCGATVDTADIEALGPWLDWAYAATKAA